MSDRLHEIFMMQRELMEDYAEIESRNGAPVVYPLDYGDVDSRMVQMRLKYLAWCGTEELSEAMHELKNRPWRQTETATDRDAFMEELMDWMHFVLELLVVAGVTPEMLYHDYTSKYRKNVERQENGY